MTAPFEQVSIVSFKDRMVIGEVSSFVNHEVMLHFTEDSQNLDCPSKSPQTTTITKEDT